jgi:hypothetical protein
MTERPNRLAGMFALPALTRPLCGSASGAPRCCGFHADCLGGWASVAGRPYLTPHWQQNFQLIVAFS